MLCKISLLIVPIFSKALLCKHQKIHIQKRFMQRAGQAAAKEKSKPSSDESINTKGFKKDINNNNNATLPTENVVKENSTTDYTASHYQTNTPKSQINSSEGKKNFDQMQQDSKKFSDKENPAENYPSDLNNNSELVNNTPNKEVEDTNYEKFQRYTGTGAPLDNNLPKNSDNPNNNNNTATINSPYTKFIPPQLRKNSPNISRCIM